jgi:hypothetical protein
MDDGIEKRTVVIADERYDADRMPMPLTQAGAT